MHYSISGNALEDLFVCLFLYPVAISQLEVTVEKGIVPLMPSSKTSNICVSNEALVISQSHDVDMAVRDISVQPMQEDIPV